MFPPFMAAFALEMQRDMHTMMTMTMDQWIGS